MKRGDVVLIDFPFTSAGQSKIRPALVVQSDRENGRIAKTILAMITGNLRRISEPTHCVVDPTTSDGATSGLRGKSLVSCINLYTVEQRNVDTTIGRLSSGLMNRVDECLKAALNLS